MNNTIHILFAATPDFLPFAIVTAMSAIKNCRHRNIKFHFMYADILKKTSSKQLQNIFECATYSLAKENIPIEFYDIKEYLNLFQGQNIGYWGEKISYSHYFYFLAPLILKDINKVIYLDTDMIVNCDLSTVMNIDMKDKLIAMGTPRGMEEMGGDVSNSGFILLNLEQWRKENTLTTLLSFGKTIKPCNFCDQNLLHLYFTKNNPDKLLLLDKNYNIFPQLFPEIPLSEIRIFHFTGFKSIKPWKDQNIDARATFLWWKYARETYFYEMFIFKNIYN